ncbi:MAG: WG repeat-containing protein [Bacteroidota bacterium]
MEKPSILLVLMLLIGLHFINAQDYVSLVKVQKDGKYGYLNDEGKAIIPCEYDIISNFHQGWVAATRDNYWTYFNAQGDTVLDIGTRYTFCGDFQDDVAFVTTQPVTVDSSENWWTVSNTVLEFINRKGQRIFRQPNHWNIAFKHPYEMAFFDGMLIVSTTFLPGNYQMHHGYFDKKGQLVLPFEFRRQHRYIENFSEGLAGIGIATIEDYDLPDETQGLYGFINKKGGWVIPPKYREIQPFRYGAALVKDPSPDLKFPRYFLINKQGKSIFGPTEETAQKYLRDSIVAIYKNGRDSVGNRDFKSMKVALAKTDGTMITDYVFGGLRAGIGPKALWRARIKLPDGKLSKVGFVNDRGELVIPYQYEDSRKGFENGLAIVQVEVDGIWQNAVINANNEMVRPPEPKAKYYLRGGVILHYEGEAPDDPFGWNYYNKKGQLIDFSGYRIRESFQYVPVVFE